MQFRKTMKNKKRFRGGETTTDNADKSIFEKVVDAIKTHSGDAASSINNLCGGEKMECSTRFIKAANDPPTLALAGISAAAYAAYLLYGTRKKQDEILQKIERIKKERRESEESSDTNDHRDSKYDDSSLSDDSKNDDLSLSDQKSDDSYEDLMERISRIRILMSTHKKPSKKLEQLQQQLHQLKRQLQMKLQQHNDRTSNLKSRGTSIRGRSTRGTSNRKSRSSRRYTDRK
jgi:hypothetical protein